MLAFFLFIALTNLTLGIVLGYFYGPMFAPQRSEEGAPAEAHHAPSAAPDTAHAPPTTTAAKAAPTAEAKPAATPPAEDLRPVKPTGTREVSALDLADVMSELGVAPAATPPASDAKPVESKPAAPSAPPITIEALTGEPAPLAG